MDMGSPINKEVELVSFHTVSKGYWGECGQRGGYFELTNIPPKVIISGANISTNTIIFESSNMNIYYRQLMSFTKWLPLR